MSSRPGRVTAQYRVDIPRPRALDAVRFSDAYREMRGTLAAALHHEVDSAR